MDQAFLDQLMLDARRALDRCERTLERSIANLHEQVLCDIRQEHLALSAVFSAPQLLRQQQQDLAGEPPVDNNAPEEEVDAAEDWSCNDEYPQGPAPPQARMTPKISRPRVDLHMTMIPLEVSSSAVERGVVEQRPCYNGTGGCHDRQEQILHIEGHSSEEPTTSDERLNSKLSFNSFDTSALTFGSDGESREKFGTSYRVFTMDRFLYGRQEGRVATLLGSTWFEVVCSVVIIINCATMGVESHFEVTGHLGPASQTVLMVLENFFTVFFLFEIILRFQVCGLVGFYPNTMERRINCLDLGLVVITGLILTWIIPFFCWITGFEESKVISIFSVLRAIRLTRLVRVFRNVSVFREAWMLIRGVADSSRTLFWTVVVIFFVTYGFAILGLSIIVVPLEGQRVGMTDVEELSRIDALLWVFGGIDRMMFTLVQVMLGDSFHAYIRELIHFLPYTWLYFYAYIALVCVVLMNLVTAIIVENAMETSRNDHVQQLQDKHEKHAAEMKQLKVLFTLMDQDGSGTLSWSEFKLSFKDKEMKNKWRLLDFRPEDCRELFQLLDDGDGEINVNEFFQGLSRMKGDAQSKDVYRLQKTLDKLQDSVMLPTGSDLSCSPLHSPSTSIRAAMAKSKCPDVSGGQLQPCPRTARFDTA